MEMKKKSTVLMGSVNPTMDSQNRRDPTKDHHHHHPSISTTTKKKQKRNRNEKDEDLEALKSYKNFKLNGDTTTTTTTNNTNHTISTTNNHTYTNNQSKLPFDYQYIMAPMVGASELPFRLFCRKYGAQLCYTPMMMAKDFASSAKYRQQEFPTSPLDRPLVCHFAANMPSEFAKAAQLAQPYCDAIDLNLGCPQRTAYVGHFGSYLLDPNDRQLIVDIIKAGVAAVSIPIFVKIRLLDTYEDTKMLLQQLYDAGATLIAVHARYRASFHRKGPGARDGPALLDQVQQLKQTFPDKLLVTNGNTITYDDVIQNLQNTQADGIMSAEGILDNPALYLNRYSTTKDPNSTSKTTSTLISIRGGDEYFWKRREELGKKLLDKMIKISTIEAKQTEQQRRDHEIVQNNKLTSKEEKRLAKKPKVIAKLANLDEQILKEIKSNNHNKNDGDDDYDCTSITRTLPDDPLGTAQVPFEELAVTAQDKTSLALEYLQWVKHYPTTMRTTIFHTRRILKVELTTYQLMEDCLACTTVHQLQDLIYKIRGYQADPATFHYDKQKAKQEKEALERKRQEEGKRKQYEARMIRKAKREGRSDLEFYLRQGAVVPTTATVQELKLLTKSEQLRLWKERNHSQHCLAYHLEGECPRGRTCAFLHVASSTANTFDESDEVAG